MEIKWIGSPNFRKQVGVDKKFIVLHWMVGTLEGTSKIFQNSKRRVATNYGIGGSEIHQYVKDEDYAFGSGTRHSNKYGISIEHEGGWLLKNGNRKKPTKLTHDTSAKLCAMLARKHKLGELKLGENVFPHKHFVATQCPGTLDMQYIIDKANQINSDCLKKEEAVIAGDVPKSPTVETYVVKKGDSLWAIAKRQKTTVVNLMKDNKLKSAIIIPGQVLKIRKK